MKANLLANQSLRRLYCLVTLMCTCLFSQSILVESNTKVSMLPNQWEVNKLACEIHLLKTKWTLWTKDHGSLQQLLHLQTFNLHTTPCRCVCTKLHK